MKKRLYISLASVIAIMNFDIAEGSYLPQSSWGSQNPQTYSAQSQRTQIPQAQGWQCPTPHLPQQPPQYIQQPHPNPTYSMPFVPQQPPRPFPSAQGWQPPVPHLSQQPPQYVQQHRPNPTYSMPFVPQQPPRPFPSAQGWQYPTPHLPQQPPQTSVQFTSMHSGMKVPTDTQNFFTKSRSITLSSPEFCGTETETQRKTVVYSTSTPHPPLPFPSGQQAENPSIVVPPPLPFPSGRQAGNPSDAVAIIPPLSLKDLSLDEQAYLNICQNSDFKTHYLPDNQLKLSFTILKSVIYNIALGRTEIAWSMLSSENFSYPMKKTPNNVKNNSSLIIDAMFLENKTLDQCCKKLLEIDFNKPIIHPRAENNFRLTFSDKAGKSIDTFLIDRTFPNNCQYTSVIVAQLMYHLLNYLYPQPTSASFVLDDSTKNSLKNALTFLGTNLARLFDKIFEGLPISSPEEVRALSPTTTVQKHVSIIGKPAPVAPKALPPTVAALNKAPVNKVHVVKAVSTPPPAATAPIPQYTEDGQIYGTGHLFHHAKNTPEGRKERNLVLINRIRSIQSNLETNKKDVLSSINEYLTLNSVTQDLTGLNWENRRLMKDRKYSLFEMCEAIEYSDGSNFHIVSSNGKERSLNFNDCLLLVNRLICGLFEVEKAICDKHKVSRLKTKTQSVQNSITGVELAYTISDDPRVYTKKSNDELSYNSYLNKIKSAINHIFSQWAIMK